MHLVLLFVLSNLMNL